jgi:hypothetical protein
MMDAPQDWPSIRLRAAYANSPTVRHTPSLIVFPFQHCLDERSYVAMTLMVLGSCQLCT